MILINARNLNVTNVNVEAIVPEIVKASVLKPELSVPFVRTSVIKAGNVVRLFVISVNKKVMPRPTVRGTYLRKSSFRNRR